MNSFRPQLHVISRLVKYVISMISHTLPFEHGWESIRFRDLIFSNEFISVRRLPDNKLANLSSKSAQTHENYRIDT